MTKVTRQFIDQFIEDTAKLLHERDATLIDVWSAGPDSYFVKEGEAFVLKNAKHERMTGREYRERYPDVEDNDD